MTDTSALTHEDATELSGLYVLDALEAPEREAVRQHLESCSLPHPEFDELGGAVPALSAILEPRDAPPELRGRVLAAVAADAAAAGRTAPSPVSAATRVWEFDRGSTAARAAGRPAWLAWAAAATAVLMIAALGAWGVILQGRTSELEQRSALIADAIAASTAQGAVVATLRGTGPAAAASGFAAFTPEGDGYILLVGLPPAPAGQTYQAWYIVDGAPHSVGVLSVGEDGYGLLEGVEAMAGTDLIAFTIEKAGGADVPTGDPIVSGEVSA